MKGGLTKRCGCFYSDGVIQEPCAVHREAWSKVMNRFVYVIVAHDGERIKESIVVNEIETAKTVYEAVKQIYGGANVMMGSRMVNDIPDNVKRAMRVN